MEVEKWGPEEDLVRWCQGQGPSENFSGEVPLRLSPMFFMQTRNYYCIMLVTTSPIYLPVSSPFNSGVPKISDWMPEPDRASIADVKISSPLCLFPIV